MKTTRLIAAAATIATMAFTATSAQAATFTPNGGQNTTITGTITWKKPGSAPIDCTLKWVRTTGAFFNQSPPCNGRSMLTNGYMVIPFAHAQGNDSIWVSAAYGFANPTPFPGVTFNTVPVTLPFIDGNATTPSTIVLNDTIVGDSYSGGSGQITWTGTLTMTQTANGGLVTVIP